MGELIPTPEGVEFRPDKGFQFALDFARADLLVHGGVLSPRVNDLAIEPVTAAEVEALANNGGLPVDGAQIAAAYERQSHSYLISE